MLITGEASFIASHVANRSDQITRLSCSTSFITTQTKKDLHPSESSLNFKIVKGDIASVDLVNCLLITESIDMIMHFATQTHVDNSFSNSFEFTKNNIHGTHVLCHAYKVTIQIRRFIHISTAEVYGETDEDAAIGNHEASQLFPTNPYYATKASAEMLVMAYGTSYHVYGYKTPMF